MQFRQGTTQKQTLHKNNSRLTCIIYVVSLYIVTFCKSKLFIMEWICANQSLNILKIDGSLMVHLKSAEHLLSTKKYGVFTYVVEPDPLQ